MSSYSILILILYILTVTSAVVVRNINKKTGQVCALLVAAISYLAAAFRPHHFPDVNSYGDIYEHASTGDLANPDYWAAHGEPFFKIICYLISLADVNYDGFLLLMSLLSLTMLIIISYISKISFAYLWLGYFSFYFITRDLGVLRLSIASHLIVISMFQKTYIRQLIILVFASISFQYFAFIAIIPRILSRYTPRFSVIILLIVLSAIIGSYVDFNTLASLAPDKFSEGYEFNIQLHRGGLSILPPVIRNLFFCLVLYFLLKNELNFHQIRLWIWSSVFSVLAYLTAAGILIIAQRFSAYFGVIYPIAFAYLLSKKDLSIFKYYLIVILCVINFMSLFYFNDFVWRLTK